MLLQTLLSRSRTKHDLGHRCVLCLVIASHLRWVWHTSINHYQSTYLEKYKTPRLSEICEEFTVATIDRHLPVSSRSACMFSQTPCHRSRKRLVTSFTNGLSQMQSSILTAVMGRSHNNKAVMGNYRRRDAFSWSAGMQSSLTVLRRFPSHTHHPFHKSPIRFYCI